MSDFWDELPRMFWEQCEGGCGALGKTVYKRITTSGGELWECKGCYSRNKAKAEGRYIGGRP